MESFRIVQAFYRAPLNLSHQQRVTRLYRAALRTLDSWAMDREIFLQRGEEIRARFTTNKGADVGLATRLLREGEEELVSWTHPDMWTNPYMPGGSKFMRNPPPPCVLFSPMASPRSTTLPPRTSMAFRSP